jgi:hypothetical protein
VFLLRLVPLLPFNMLNYLLSVTPVPLGEYALGSWLGMMVSSSSLINYILRICSNKVTMNEFLFSCIIAFNYSNFLIPPMLLSQPLTVALVYAGTTLKDLSDVTHDMGEFSKTRLVRDTILNYIYQWTVARVRKCLTWSTVD